MSVQSNVEIHPHQEFHFAENTDSSGCCCFWKSKSKPKEYVVDEKGTLHPKHKTSVRERIIANQRLSNLITNKFEEDPIENDKAFEMLKMRIEDPMSNGHPITEEKLMRIVNEMYSLKRELKRYEGL